MKRYGIIPVVILSLLLGVFAQLSAMSRPASSISNSDFNPELIITDDVFTNKNSMSASQIQSFLQNKNSVCLKNFTTLSLHDSNRDGLGDEPYGKGKNEKVSASTLIYQAAQLYGINPQVILATLEKEQGLVTRQDCPTWRYNTALGYGCPDSAPCDNSAYGFTRQIDYGVWHFKGFFHDTFPVPPTVPGKKYIQYNPSASCGGKTINIANRATAALYSYTPYQPNGATLAAAPGQTVSCGAYGNLNFWRYFTLWFGSTEGTPFFRINNSSAIYIESSGSGYYHVPSQAVLESYGGSTGGAGSVFKGKPRNVPSSYVSGLSNLGKLPQVARFEGGQIFAVANHQLYPFTSRDMYEKTYGLTMGEEAKLPAGLLYRYKTSTAVQSISQAAGLHPVYSVESGKKRHISSQDAYQNLGSPVYSSRSKVVLDAGFMASIKNGAPIMAPSTLVKTDDTNKWYLWTGTNLLPIDHSLASTLSIESVYITSQNTLSQLPVSSQMLGRYAKDSKGLLYALHKSSKYPLTNADIDRLDLPLSSFTPTPDSFLNKFTTRNPHASFIRIESNDRVYKTNASAMYGMYDSHDFKKLGGSFADVISIPAYLESMYEKRGYQFSSTRLVQVTGDPEVYIVDSEWNMHHVLTREIAKQYGISLTNIAKIPALSQASAYRVSSNGLTRFSKSPDGSIWLTDTEGRYPITEAQLASYFGYSSAQFTTLSNELISLTSQRAAFSQYGREPSTGKVYKIEAGKKQWYTARAAFERSGIDWSEVINYSSEFLATIPTGTSIK